MTQPENNPDPRVEQFLRQWGADEACKEASVPPLASTGKLGRIAASRTTGGWWMRWAPTLAAALVLLTTGAMFYVNFLPTGPVEHSRNGALTVNESRDEPQANLRELRLELADTRRQVKKLKEELDRTVVSGPARVMGSAQDAPASERRAGGMPVVREQAALTGPAVPGSRAPEPEPERDGSVFARRRSGDAGGLADDSDSDSASGLPAEKQEPSSPRMGIAAARLDEALVAAEKVEGLSGEVRQLRKQVGELQENSRIALDKVDKLTRAAAARDAEEDLARGRQDEIQQLRLKQAQDVEVAEEFGRNEKTRLALQNRIDQLERKTKRLEAALSVSYRMAAADGRQGLAGWQIAAARSELARRAGLVRPSASGEKTAKLIDRIEFVLLRLEQVSPEDPASRKSLGEMIGEGKLIEMIDERIDSQAEAAKVEAWLLEARVILEGVKNVG